MADISPTTTWTFSDATPTTLYVSKEILIYGTASTKHITWESTTSVWGD